MGNLALHSAEEPDNLRATTGTVEVPTEGDNDAALVLGARPIIQQHEPAAAARRHNGAQRGARQHTPVEGWGVRTVQRPRWAHVTMAPNVGLRQTSTEHPYMPCIWLRAQTSKRRAFLVTTIVRAFSIPRLLKEPLALRGNYSEPSRNRLA